MKKPSHMIRLSMCYKSSKDHSPQLDVNLLGSSVVHKEKQVRKQEHKLKIVPMNADVIVLGLQSRDQAEQWLRVIQEVSSLPSEGTSEGNQYTPEAQRPNCQKPDIAEKYLSASEYGGSVDGHAEVSETKDVKKKCSAGLKLSNLMNLGRKKSTSLEPPERPLETSSYLNVLVNSQWKSRWCSVRDSHLHFYQDRNRSKVAQQPLSLVGCEVVPDPSPDHLYSFRILHNGEELAKLEAKSSEEMGHWLGLLLSESGSKTDPEEFTYDYVDAERVSCIVNAAKNSFLLMQRKFSEPNTYIDGLPSQAHQEELYDDVEMSELPPAVEPAEEATLSVDVLSENEPDRLYLDLTPLKPSLHSSSSLQARAASPVSPQLDDMASVLPADAGPAPEEFCIMTAESQEQRQLASQEPEEPTLRVATVKLQAEQQRISFPPNCPDILAAAPASTSPPVKDRLRVTSAEIKLGKNRTEAEVKRYTEEKERLEKMKEEIRGHLAQLRKEKRELKETLLKCTDKGILAILEQKLKEIDEECRIKESRRVDLELNIMEVKDNLKKAEAGPVTLGTTVDTTHLDNMSPRPKAAAPTQDCTPVNSATALKNRPLSVMVTGKGTVLQKAKEWEKKGAS
ncbi:actin filament-associated protein 1-like 2 isoform X3 [Fukomys damarensis]|uniref:actin filament-associated protein 1-like 2 isoform X3 n=1 Tax=Fukomys damarensis TaxID=885580 RepID=UPI001454FFDB|nr:actin filament-associated protein 1-like 2 isoform X3 [Fukomys damarensis]